MNLKVIQTAIANLYIKDSFKSEIVSQAFFWEPVIIIKKKNQWYKIKQFDSYESWCHKYYLCDLLPNVKFLELYNDKNIISISNYTFKKISSSISIVNYKNFNLLNSIPFNSFIPIHQNKKTITYNYVLHPKNFLFKIKKTDIKQNETSTNFRQQIVDTCKLFLGAPYMWGGKTCFGIDCSGLVQTIINYVLDIHIPRDAKDQFLSPLFDDVDITNCDIGDLLFFGENGTINHVGFNVADGLMIHSSGLVKYNSILNPASEIDLKLSRQFIAAKSIKNIIN